MSEWTGMHNPEQHKVEDGDDFTGCSGCFEECSADWPCRCCIAAEVGRLTAELASRDRRVAEAITSDDAVKAFGAAWGQANSRLSLAPGDRRRAGLAAVAKAVAAILEDA